MNIRYEEACRHAAGIVSGEPLLFLAISKEKNSMVLEKKLQRIRKWIGGYYWDMHCKEEFLRSCPKGARVLDVGCGNNSPFVFKSIRPDFYYVGIDIGEYRHRNDPTRYADEYIIVASEQFNDEIETMYSQFDIVVSSHNLEHCDDPGRTLVAMLRAVRPNGRIFLSFPSEASVNFPRRGGTLNFYDDPTHKQIPIFVDVCSEITRNGFSLDVVKRRYRPLVRLITGLLAEPRSYWRNEIQAGTWALYGFETIIWASRTANDSHVVSA
jgi:SAM-dependent methyltransferase